MFDAIVVVDWGGGVLIAACDSILICDHGTDSRKAFLILPEVIPPPMFGALTYRYPFLVIAF